MKLDLLFWISCGGYLIGWALFCLSYVHIKETVTRQWGQRLLAAGLLAHVVFMVMSAVQTVEFVFGSLSGLLLLVSLLTVAIYFIINFYFPNKIFGVTFPPLIIFTFLLSVVINDLQVITPFFLNSPSIINKIAVYIHASLTMASYLLFIVAGVMGAIFLFQENRIKKKTLPLDQGNVPSLGILGVISYRVIAIGFVLFSAGLLIGVGMNAVALNKVPTLSFRQMLPAITWLFYVVFLVDRSLNGTRGKLSAIWSIIACLTAVISFIYEISMITDGV